LSNSEPSGQTALPREDKAMGQRHQIYLRLPAMYNEDNPNHQPTRVVGIHHQWLYGQTAMKLLVNFLTFLDKAENKYSGRDVLEILQCAYAIHPETGYFHGICPELDKNEVENPMNADNNDGITIIDLTNKKPKYCFMSLHHLECLDQDVDEEEVPNLEPFDAKTYIGLHYKNYAAVKEDKFFKLFSHHQNKYVAIKNFADYKRYNSLGKATKKDYDDSVKDSQDFRKLTRKLVAFLSKYEVLTRKDVQEIFPRCSQKPKMPKMSGIYRGNLRKSLLCTSLDKKQKPCNFLSPDVKEVFLIEIPTKAYVCFPPGEISKLRLSFLTKHLTVTKSKLKRIGSMVAPKKAISKWCQKTS
jgi:hypothetical protein